MIGMHGFVCMVKRRQFHINGQVQGVGFRPCVYQIAIKLNLTGWVRNDASGVTLEVQGELVEHFWEALIKHLPPLAKIDTVYTNELPINMDEYEFVILKSESGHANTLISPDVAICASCLDELFDKKSRFYHYPFLNCTQCGPRLTITYQLPYDRGQTSMASFPFCMQCEADYQNPNNRRYHAQPTACEKCGPMLSASLSEIAKNIQQGNIIALKGLGGYQLICDANHISAIMQLRQRKNRLSKPFAVMVLNVESAKIWANVNEQETLLLNSEERPIVLLHKKFTNTMLDAIAPDLHSMGIMLPCTPLHYLLFHAMLGFPEDRQWLEKPQPWVFIVTSANSYGNPIVVDEKTAQQELNAIADIIISYNRRIVTRMDDSVLQLVNHSPCFIRRARGYLPKPIKLAKAIPSILALGGHLKNTFCITRHNEAFLSQHIGDLKNKASRDFFHESLTYFLKFLAVEPEYITHDKHPDFYSTQFAYEYAQANNIPTISVQHHHAHLASVAAEYQLQEPALGLALDGYGYGSDHTMWGGELFLVEQEKAERLSHLQPLALPGGDKAATDPWYMGASVLDSLGLTKEIVRRFSEQPNAALIASLLEKKMSPTSSSCGRLFDAAAALLGIHATKQYEGQAAMKLESLVTHPQVMQGGWNNTDHGLSLLPLFAQLLHLDPVAGANLFHGTLVAALTEWVIHWSKIKQINIILLSGGCFLNKILAEGLINSLQKAHSANLRVLFPQKAPPNDGGIALGQAWIGGLSCV